MPSRQSSKAALITWASLAGVLLPPHAQAVDFDWTAAELSCSASLGLDLMSPTEPATPKFVEHISWLAEHIVIATVGEIKHDIRGPYPTLVAATVATSLKGSLQPNASFTVALKSGPAFHPVLGVMGEVRVSGESKFAVGEQVLLFLETDYEVPDNNPTYYALPANHYRLIDGYKFKLQGASFVQEDFPSNSFPIAHISARINALVAAQQALCGGGQ